MKNIVTRHLLPLAISLAATTAQAQAGPEDPSDGTGYIGAAILLNSEYLGSGDEELRAVPYLSFDNVKGFTLFGSTLRYRALDVGTGQGLGKWSLRAGPSVSYQEGRSSEESINLTGFEDIGGSVPIGGFIRSTIGPIGFGLNVGKDIAGGHDGIIAEAAIGTLYKTGNFAIQPAATVSWANGEHNSRFFGVTDSEAASSGLSRFSAGSGIYAYSIGIVSWVEIQDKYAVTLIANHRWFTNDAADSPILNASDGSKTGVVVSLGIARKFDTKSW